MQHGDIHLTIEVADRGPGEQEMRPVVMASVGVLGFLSLSPTYQDR
jgi:hypothetical protein